MSWTVESVTLVIWSLKSMPPVPEDITPPNETLQFVRTKLAISYQEVAFEIGPEIGQVTDAVESSPTAPFRGVHSETRA